MPCLWRPHRGPQSRAVPCVTQERPTDQPSAAEAPAKRRRRRRLGRASVFRSASPRGVLACFGSQVPDGGKRVLERKSSWRQGCLGAPESQPATQASSRAGEVWQRSERWQLPVQGEEFVVSSLLPTRELDSLSIVAVVASHPFIPYCPTCRFSLCHHRFVSYCCFLIRGIAFAFSVLTRF